MKTDKKRRRWEYIANNAYKFERWRRPGPTRALIAWYFIGIALAIVCLVATFAWIHFLWFYIVTLLSSMVAWTILRSTIDVKDMAPDEVLDDYEAEVLDIWRRRSFTLFEAALLIGGVLVIFLGVIFQEHIDVVTMSVFAGIYMIMIYLSVGTLPAVGFALTFNRTDSDSDPDSDTES